MKIRLGILDNDVAYLNRFVSAFNVKYADKLEIYSFTEKNAALQSLRTAKADVFLANEAFGVTQEDIPANCGFAYLVGTADIETISGVPTVFKFQKAEQIYRQILGIFSEKVAATTGIRLNEENSGKVLAFVSAGGGTGSSTAAAACAVSFAEKGKKTLYLNLERLGSADIFFHADGNIGLGDVIYAIKSRKGNLAMKLESALKHDATGVYFYSSTKMALDIAELNTDEIQQIISALKMSGSYDYIILDMDFSLEKSLLMVLEECNTVVFVADGSTVSNCKLERAVESLNVLEQQGDMKILMRSGILYNRFSSQTSRKAHVEGLKEFGGINRYEGFDTPKLLQQLKTQQVFQALE